jgi:hypothetical protein
MHSPAFAHPLGLIRDPMLRQEIGALRTEGIALLDAEISPKGAVSKCLLAGTTGKLTIADPLRAQTLLLLFQCKPRTAGLYRFDVRSVTLTITPAGAAEGRPVRKRAKAKSRYAPPARAAA